MSAATKPHRLEHAVAQFVAHKRALGCRYYGPALLLGRLCRHLEENGAYELDADSFQRWVATLRNRHPNTRYKAHQIVRNFCLHRQRSEPGCFVPSDGFAKLQPYVTPVIIEPEQIARMLELASRLMPNPRSPLRGPIMRLAVVLLYTAGLRLGELLRLAIGDVDDNGTVLRIRESKFHKSRLVPLSPSASRELRDYLRQRDQVFQMHPHSPLLCGHRRRGPKGYSHPGMQAAIRGLYFAAGVQDHRGRYPRVHDMRHSFALQALIRWYRAGADVQSSLPKLALFMGHVSIESSAYYLRWIPTLRRLASDRFEDQFGRLVGEGVR
jgi:integrase/recombinase XerD